MKRAPGEYYPSLDEAKRALGKFVVKSSREYRKLVRSQKDPGLPACPEKLYPNWQG